jgi:putative SOS response-associated peptidase YedK
MRRRGRALASKRKVGFQTCLQRTRWGLTPNMAAEVRWGLTPMWLQRTRRV